MGTYNLGTIGLGHWVKRLHEVLKKKQEIKLVKTVGTRSFDDKKEELLKYGISESNYYQAEAGKSLPNNFFEGVDIVHIASPNQFHKLQTMQSLENGKVTVTEKTFATNKEDFDRILSFIRNNRLENKVTIHLHYLSKALTAELRRRLPELVRKHGKITGISATFFEKTDEEDARRSWLFKPENGGVFMDWVHPISIITNVLGADNWRLSNTKTFIAQPEYDKVNPTAVEARFQIEGVNFQNANAIIRVGKGLDVEQKKIRINFEHATVYLEYLSTEQEITSGGRGRMKIITTDEMETVNPIGPLSYEIMIEEMMNMLKGNKPHISLSDFEKIYAPEWMFQKISRGISPIKDENEIKIFVQNGLKNIL